MLAKIPIAATPLSLGMLSKSLFKGNREELAREFSSRANVKYLYFCNSGLSACYLILKTLQKKSKRQEVALPAYTAPSLAVAVKKAGLRVRLSDISLEDFNADLNLLGDVSGNDTLAILAVHMFGLVAQGIPELKQKFSNTFIIEDCAQAMGSRINGSSVGSLGDASFFSFNKGKNIPTYGGGCIATNSEDLFKDMVRVSEEFIKEPVFYRRLNLVLKNFCLSLAVRPFIYGLGHRFISLFKDNAPARDIRIEHYTDFQAAVAWGLLENLEDFSRKRYSNGLSLLKAMKGLEGITLPKIQPETQPAFNRLPVIIKDLERRDILEKKLWKAGIETSRLYLKPIHHIFDLGYKSEDFPNAVYLAEHLLTLPVHPMVSEAIIEKMINIFKEALA
ncbi:MAG: DegT/DnrJ/EryC1/StrS family aminotransferase [Candidatus Omnitrophica bacterium]|nr:DegT/DnrJ/EryC1/StrS family aminotransferase [Candidatus Omnitrophota bacterium]MDD5236286.1 DegT/DnrJ/EryC1/StrS family aminotransferase [Candidatus Omnitrophota bacterium]MDD5610524.1 DegT/DnrJ/EryC1/StrS family aminotransferase [Candidatus Omnitrophota bacterium]